jgi:hypothetical protein
LSEAKCERLNSQDTIMKRHTKKRNMKDKLTGCVLTDWSAGCT